jgi:hypothetical protein
MSVYHIYKVLDESNPEDWKEPGIFDIKSYVGIENRFDSVQEAFFTACKVADIIAMNEHAGYTTIGNHITIMKKDASKTLVVHSEEDWNRGLR